MIAYLLCSGTLTVLVIVSHLFAFLAGTGAFALYCRLSEKARDDARED